VESGWGGSCGHGGRGGGTACGVFFLIDLVGMTWF